MLVLLIAVFVAVLVLVFALISKKQPSSPVQTQFPYYKKEAFLSNSERSFFEVLQKAVGVNYYVFPQIRLSNLVVVKKGASNWQACFNRIHSRTIDFLICDKTSVLPLLAIELDDASHQSEKRMERDDFVNTVLEAAGVDIMHVRAQGSYKLQELANDLNEQLKRGRG